MEMTEEKYSELEDQKIKIIQYKKMEEKWLKKNEQSLRDLWGTIKRSDVCVINVPEREDKEYWRENIFEK